MHIGLYFGSFNPIHIGHLIIANHVLQHSTVDKIWFVVSPHNPLKESSTLLNEYHRLHLVEIAIANNPKFRASSVEFSLPKPSYTIDTLCYLKEKFPFEQFSIIMGGDSFQNIHRWKNQETLLKNYELIVYRRPGFEINIPEGSRVNVMDAPLLEISASFIRQQLRDKKSVQYLLPDAVWEYVTANRYYL